jgi:hypothetical protein
LAECQLPKLNVAGSIPVARSIPLLIVLLAVLLPGPLRAGPLDIWAVRAGLEPSDAAEPFIWRLYDWFSLDSGDSELPGTDLLLRSLKTGDMQALVPLVASLVAEGRLDEARAFMESRGELIPATRHDLAVALAWYGRYDLHQWLTSRPDAPPDLVGDTYEASIAAMLMLGWMDTSPDGLFHGDWLAGPRDVDMATAVVLGTPAGGTRDWIGIDELDQLFGADRGEGTYQ